ncbi:MAG TPA: bifunctional nuclease family protein [Fimbriimonadaceae bacterium]|nr:bifunctional nuclease family protein [Fimbriimonadaceae bacterium]HRJ97788.1 bifunctional nuclease family protein [Fimbriimonadaceae bacterium]
MSDELPDDSEGLDKPPSFFPYEGDVDLPRDPGERGEPIECTIEGVFGYESNGNIQRFVLLSDGERKVPILIGPFEAQAISLPLDGATPDRPMTHDLMRNIIDRLGAELVRVVIDDLWSTTYYAKMYLRRGEEEMEIDSRPSDAIAMAVRFEAPIFVVEGILSSSDE